MPPDQQEQIRFHLDTCSRCQQMVDSLSVNDHTLPAEAPLVARDEPACVEAMERLLQQAGEARAYPDSSDETCAEGGVSLDFLQPSRQPGYIGRLDHYEIIELIGRGGMGIVLRAFDEKLRRIVAIKVMAPQIATSVSARKRFVREAQAAAAVRNEHVIDIHAVEDAGGLPYLVMEYIEGISLAERIKRSGPLKLNKVLRIGMQTATGLASAHAQGLVHRDIKPENILLENGVERVKITDFGLARAVDDASLTQSGVLAGTPQYMSPEQARGDPVDPRSDLFSLGSVLYAMCTGHPPFRAETTVGVLKRVTDDTPRPVRSLNAEVTDELAALIEKLLAKDARRWFQTAAEVSVLLSRQLAHVQQPAQAPLTSNPQLPQKGNWSRWLVAVAVLLLGLGLAGYQFRSAIYPFVTNQGVVESDTDDPGTKASDDPNSGLIAPLKGSTEREPFAASFIVLGADGKSERPFATLAEAVAAADGGDIVEVRGNGPMIRESIFLHGKALTIRAAPGSRPILEFTAVSGAAQGDYVRLQTDAPLVLEGLEVRRVGATSQKERLAEWVVVCRNAPLRVANCRIVVRTEPATVALWADKSALLEVRNCQFDLGTACGCADWEFTATGRMIWDNNVVCGGAGPYCHYRRPAQDVFVQLTRSTFLGPAMHFLLDMPPQGAVREGDAIPPPFRVEAAETIFHARGFVFGFGQDFPQYVPDATALPPAEAEALLPRLVGWQGQRNLYPDQIDDFLALGASLKRLQSTRERKTLDDWRQFWGTAETDSRQGRIRHEGVNLWMKAGTAPDQLAPGDFRLHPESAGFRAGKDGRDLGADVDLVGPGPAYERWKQTPAYEQWRRETGQGTRHGGN